MIGPATLPPIQVLGAVRGDRCSSWRFTWFFKKSRMGVAMRAVADNQQVAQAMGINVERYFALAWAMAGIVSALGGIIWGSMLGVDVQLALVGLKVFPVVILGGLDSIGGAVVGGLIVGVVESLAAGYLDPYVGGGTKDFAPYVLMILVLMFRPYGIFGKRTDRARVDAHVPSRSPESSRPPTPPTWRSIRCRSRAGRWRRWLVLFAVDPAADAARILPLDPQPDLDRRRRRARAQHPGRLHRPDLGRPWRLHVGRRLYRGQPGGAGSACRSGSRCRRAG